MGYGISKSEEISSDSTDTFEVVVNNNARSYQIFVKTDQLLTSGYLNVKALNSTNDRYQDVITKDGRIAKISLTEPDSMLIVGNSINSFKFTPVDLESGKSYQVFVENLGVWQ